MKFKTRKTAVAALVSSALFCSPFLAYAQDANEEVEAESKSKKDVELILVTGSFVRRLSGYHLAFVV